MEFLILSRNIFACNNIILYAFREKNSLHYRFVSVQCLGELLVMRACLSCLCTSKYDFFLVANVFVFLDLFCFFGRLFHLFNAERIFLTPYYSLLVSVEVFGCIFMYNNASNNEHLTTRILFSHNRRHLLKI